MEPSIVCRMENLFVEFRFMAESERLQRNEANAFAQQLRRTLELKDTEKSLSKNRFF